jgi:hypothetical protein
MKTKSVVTLILLFVMSFSIMHEYIFALYDPEPCTTSEYVLEFEGPTDKDDICDIRYKYHHAFLQPQYLVIPKVNVPNFSFTPKDESYIFQTNLELIKPPIA